MQNVSKYVLMGASSNFGNMFSMAGATLILPFLPMLPIQILLNNLIYNVSEIAIPFDSVDPEAIVKPVQWDIKLIERFMLVFGPVSSVFDFLTFYALLAFFGAGEALFQTGWFIESMTTQTLVVFCIRTRRLFFRSRPHAAARRVVAGAGRRCDRSPVAADRPLVRLCGTAAGVLPLPGRRDPRLSRHRGNRETYILSGDRRGRRAQCRRTIESRKSRPDTGRRARLSLPRVIRFGSRLSRIFNRIRDG